MRRSQQELDRWNGSGGREVGGGGGAGGGGARAKTNRELNITGQ